MISDVDLLLHMVKGELMMAREKHPAFHSAHEGYAVILEELDELKEEVWKKNSKRDITNMRRECIQVAAMAVRFHLDLLKRGE